MPVGGPAGGRRHTHIAPRQPRAALDRYSYADRTSLPAALDLLFPHCDCSVQPWCHAGSGAADPTMCKTCPSSQRFRLSDGLTYCPFQPGSAIEVGVDGRISYARSPHGSADYGAGFYEKGGPGRPFAESPHWPQLPRNRRPCAPDGLAPCAPLPAAFRVVRAGRGESPAIPFRVPVRDGGAVGAGSTTTECPAMVTRKIPMPREAFIRRASSYLEDVEDDMGHDLALHEDELCARQVRSLAGDATFVCHYDSTLGDLEAFVGGLNRRRPEGLLLDTVLVTHGMYLVLFGNDPRTPDWTRGYPDYRNMTCQNGITFFHPEPALYESGFAMSREQGPVFVHGPTTVSCGEDGVEVERHCAVAAPPDSGIPEVPWGVKFDVVMEWNKGRAAGGGGMRAPGPRGDLGGKHG